MYDPTPSLDTLGSWMEELIEAPTPQEKDRVLMGAVLALTRAGAAALWRRMPDGKWAPWISQGPSEHLPPAAWVQAVLAGELSPEFPGGIWLVGKKDGTRVLVLGAASEEAADVAEALLVTRELCAEGGKSGLTPETLLDELPGLLDPSDENESQG